MPIRNIAIALIFSITGALLLTSCQTTYYAVWEKLGKEKRHLLHDQVEKTREDQEKASEHFKNALTRLKEMYGLDGGDLEKMYNRLSDDNENCKQRAAIIDERIEKVQRIAQDLFVEWGQEIDQIQTSSLKNQSARNLKATQARFASLDAALISARKSMNPVLVSLNDYVLYLKHNLNAQAIGSLRGEVSSIETDVDRLIRDIQKSIHAADTFLKEFGK